jgi:hypothetical protein
VGNIDYNNHIDFYHTRRITGFSVCYVDNYYPYGPGVAGLDGHFHPQSATFQQENI